MRPLPAMKSKQLGSLVFGVVGMFVAGGYLLISGQPEMVKDAPTTSIAGAERGDVVKQSADESEPDVDGGSAIGGRSEKLSEKYGDAWKNQYQFRLAREPVDVDRLDEFLVKGNTDRVADVVIVAAHHDDFETIEKIIDSGVLREKFDKYLFSSIGRRAMYDKKLGTLKWALAKGMSPSDRRGATDPIIEAAKAGPEFVLTLFEAGLDPNGAIFTGTDEQIPILAYLANQARFEETYLKAFRLALDYGGRRPELFDLYAKPDWDELVAKAMAVDMSDVYDTRSTNGDVSDDGLQDSDAGKR